MKNHKERIELEDSMQDIFVKLGEGNPGGLTVCMELAQVSCEVDPACLFGPLGPLLSLDSFGIYGSRIWMLHKDVCGCDHVKTLACLRARQLAIITQSELDHAIDNYGEGVDPEDLLAKVDERLKDLGGFGKPKATEKVTP